MRVSILLIDLCLVTFYVIALFLLLLNSTNLCLPAKITYLTFCCGFRFVCTTIFARIFTHFINDMYDKYRKSGRRLWKSSGFLPAQV